MWRSWRLAPGALMLCGVACSAPKLPDLENALPIEARCDDRAPRHYLPADMLRFLPRHRSADGVWTAEHILEAMQEPRLWCGAAPDSYRVLWLHSRSDSPPMESRRPPTVVRMSRTGRRWTATAIQLASSVNRQVVLRSERVLSEMDVQDMAVAVARFGPWPREEVARNRDAADRAEWIIERRSARLYDPELIDSGSDAAAQLMSVFLQLAGVDPRYIRLTDLTSR